MHSKYFVGLWEEKYVNYMWKNTVDDTLYFL